MRIACFIAVGMMVVAQSSAGVSLHSEDLSGRSSYQIVDPAAQNERMLQVGEELEYSVHYSFFNIGTIHFKVTEKEFRNGREVYHACAIMDSNPSLSWLVDLHIRFYSEMDQDAFTYYWLSEDSTSKITTFRKMHFDYENHKMFFEWGKNLKQVNM